jgi:uncharacterized protein (TIGR03083 family)
MSETALGLSEDEFARPTRCAAWNVKELLSHLYWAINRINAALAEPEPPSADTDSVSYWRSYVPAADAPDIADRAKELSNQFATGADLARGWDGMWRKAIESSSRTDPARVVMTWGPALRLDEFLKTRVLEVTVHRMDLDDALGRKGWGTDQAVSIVDDILSGLLGEDPPRDLEWDSVEFIEAATGRRPLTPDKRRILGPLAGRFPLLG